MKNLFATIMSIEDCITELKKNTLLEKEERSFTESCGYIVAENIYAKEDMPLANRSCMDGYAVRSADTFGASASNPVYLECVGSFAIHEVPTIELQPFECAEILTGGILPKGADAIVMLEQTQKMGARTISIQKTSALYEHCMLQGEDACSGEIALKEGTYIRPQEIGFLASLGVLSVSVYKKPVVAIFSTGDEIIEPNEALSMGFVRDANSYIMEAFIRNFGCEVVHLPIVSDSFNALHNALEDALAQADIVLLSGGSSVGSRDYTISVVESLEGAKIIAHGLAIHPGKPTILASVPKKYTVGMQYICGLPGQITSAYCVLVGLILPFISYQSGNSTAFDRKTWKCTKATLSRNIAGTAGRESWVRVALVHENGFCMATPILGKSGLLRTILESDGILVIPANVEGIVEGTEVCVYTV